MKDQAIKAAIDLYLKKATLTAKREIEKAVRDALAKGTLKNSDTVTMG